MLTSRLSRLGSSIVNELSGTICLTISTTRYIQRPYHHYQCSLFKVPPEMKTSLAIFPQSHNFCTLASNNASEENGQKVTISVTFVNKDGEEKHIKVPIGMSILEAAHENDRELEGAREGSLACSTCHVVVMDMEYYNKLQDPTEEENDMLDLAFGLTETSRLGCQVIARPELDGIHLAIPPATRNFAVAC